MTAPTDTGPIPVQRAGSPTPPSPWATKRCEHCDRPISNRYCCAPQLTDMLDETLDRYHRLNPRPGVTDNGRPPPGFHSTPPMSLHVGTIRDRRSLPRVTIIDLPARSNSLHPDGDPIPAGPGPNPDDEPNPPLSVVHEMYGWARVVVEDRGFRWPRITVPGLVEFLRTNLDWLTRQPWVDELHRDLRRLVRQLRVATGEPPERPVGHCIDMVGPEHDRRYCGYPIYMPDSEPRAPDEPISSLPTLQCDACGALYAGAQIVRLKMAEENPTGGG